MKLTTNYGLKKPEGSDVVNIDDFNYNADIIDNTFKEIKTDTVSISDEDIIQLFKNNDGDETNPLAYYTKSEIDTKIKTIDNNINTNKNLINQAIEKSEQAFQYGDNVKSKLVDKLISEGLNVSTNNTFDELISSIALGKKWASGTFNGNNLYYERYGNDRTVFYIDVNNLGFTPNIIVIHPDFDGSRSSDDNIIIYNKYISETKFFRGFTSGSAQNFLSINTSVSSSFPNWYRGIIKDNGFMFEVYFISNVSSTTASISEHSWYAFE